MLNSSLSDDKLLEALLPLIKRESSLSEITENEIIAYFESRGENAVKVLKEKKLHKLVLDDNTTIWEVEGRNNNYIIIEDNYCECTDFQIRVLSKGKKTLCYHLLAKIIGEKLEIYDVKEMTSEEYNQLLESKM